MAREEVQYQLFFQNDRIKIDQAGATITRIRYNRNIPVVLFNQEKENDPI